MPRFKYPPTPGPSTGPTAQEKPSEMEGTFVLPPAAINQRSPPASPILQRKRTLSGSAKNREALPPPPSRARKIIQMQPKEEQPQTSTTSAGSSSGKTDSPKRKQPSATSAAGRKMARKTAHSIIERRRRSKMNEEFGVLKDMIPACKGVEMHKLAILQAGIEYVKYLQGCVDKLQEERRGAPLSLPAQILRRQEMEEDEDSEEDDDMDETSAFRKTSMELPQTVSDNHSHRYRRTSTTTTASSKTTTTSAHASPALRPSISSSSLASQQRQLPALTSKSYSTSPPPLTAHTPLQTGVSPAFNAIHFNPELGRTYSNQSHLGRFSPSILPLPKAAMPIGSILGTGATGEHSHSQPLVQEGHAEATATAALMMLTNDRRDTIKSIANTNDRCRTGGMSVRDLLSH